MPTTTTNYSFNKPTVGGDEDAWGGYLNGNWDTLDTLLGGVTNAELSILDGATVTTAELNILDGVTATAAELNILDGVTATAAELNALDGITATVTELNYNDITTLGTVEASKTVTASSGGGVTFPDNQTAAFGSGSDLQIFHDSASTHSFIKEVNTGGSLRILGNDVQIQNADGSAYYVQCQSGAATTVYHNGNAKIATTSTGINVTGTAVTDGVTVDGPLDIEEVREKVTTATSTSGTTDFDTRSQGVVFFTNNQTANRTINFTNVNSDLATGQSYTCTVLATQGSTAYYFNAYQVDGTAVTPKWSGGSAPTAGNASGIDVYTFTIIKTADATFTVLASQTQYA